MLSIAKSTAYLWTKDTVLSSEEKAHIVESLSDARKRALPGMNSASSKRYADDAALLTVEAEMKLNHRRIMRAVMFWCEGQKDIGSGVRFINPDPIMMRSFLMLLRSGFDIDESKFRALVHLHEYHDERIQVQFRSEITGIPVSQFHKSYLRPHTGKNVHDGYSGCLSLRYGDARLAKLLKMIYSNLGKSLGA